MTSPLAWLEAPPVVPLTWAATGAPGSAGIRYDGLMGATPEDALGAVDLLAGPEGRAAHLCGVLPAGGALARAAAVWVHTGRLRPGRTDVVVEPHRRVHAPHVVVHRQHLADGDVVRVAGVPTTAPVRTAVDLLCFVERRTAVAGVRALLHDGLAASVVGDALRGADRRLPVRRALAILELVAGRAV